MSPIRRLSVVLAVVVVASLYAVMAWGAPVRGFTDRTGVIHITNSGQQGHKEPTPRPAEPAVAKNLQLITHPTAGVAEPLKKVEVPAFSPPQDQSSPQPPTKAAEPPASPPAAVVHKPAQGVESSPEIQAIDPDSPAADPILSPIRYVAAGKPASTPREIPRATQAQGGGGILVYRDGKGVLHINNSGVAGLPENYRPLPNGHGQEAAFLPVSQPEPPRSPPSGGGGPTLQQVAWPGHFPLPQPPSTLQAPKATVPLGPGTIRRYRDSRGVLHVTNAGAPGVESGPPARWAGAGQGVALAACPSGVREGPGLPEAWRPPPNTAKVVVGRDRQGRLTIHSINPETRVAQGPSPAQAGLEPVILEASQRYGLPVPLIMAVIQVESDFIPQAVSPKGALGLMQLMPGTAESLGVKDPFSPWENVMAGCRHLRWLFDTFHGSLPLGLAAYNAGHQRVIKAGFRIPDIKETQNFVIKVMERYNELIPGGQPAFRF
jgi:hypothetical protein